MKAGTRIPTALSIAALAVAVLGTTPLGQAAGRLIVPANSVGTTQLKKGAVTGGKIKPGSLTAALFRGGQLPAGPKGDTGAAGPAGPQGPKGDSGATTAVVRTALEKAVPSGSEGSLDIACNAGERALGGGGVFFGGGLGDHLRSSLPVHLIRDSSGKPTGGIAGVSDGEPADGWEVTGVNGAAGPRDFGGYVVCAAA